VGRGTRQGFSIIRLLVDGASVLRRSAFKSVSLLLLLLGLGLMPNGCTKILGDFTIADDAGVASDAAETDAAVCAVGSAQCSNGYLYTCNSEGTGYIQSEVCSSADLCDATDGGSCAKCTEGVYGCDGPNLNQCVNGAWQLRQACESANLCNVELMSCAGCKDGDPPQCSGPDQTILQQCKGDRWTTVDSCASATLCTASIEAASSADAGTTAPKCMAPGCTPAGAYECDGNALLRCPPNQLAWDPVDTCQSAALCAQSVADPAGTATRGDKCAAAVCSPAGSYLCTGQVLEECSDDLTRLSTVQTCVAPLECNATLATCQACNPGDYECNGTDLQQCAPDATWKLVAKCASSATCDALNGQCKTPACAPGAFKCEASGVPASSSTAGESPVELEQCNAMLTGWDPVTACISAALCDANSGRCLDPACPAAGALQCNGAALQQCKSDQSGWTTVTTCPAGQACNPDLKSSCVAQCAASVNCNGKVRQTCTNSSSGPQIASVATCATAALCNCALANPETCLDGVTADKLCGVVVCGGSLAQHQCVGAALQQCSAGRDGWVADVTCDSALRCVAGTPPTYSDGYCAVCDTANAVTCNPSASPATLTTCSADRKSISTVKCATGRSCFSATSGAPYCAVCTENSKQCGSGAVQTCQKGQWVTTATCGAGVACVPGTGTTTAACGTCVEGSKTCTGGNIDVCTNGALKLSTTCANGCAVGASTCYACGADSSSCLVDGVTLQTCSAHVLGNATCPNGCTPGASTCGISCSAPSCSSDATQYCDPTSSLFIRCPTATTCSVNADAGSAGCT
jgi:hypothetical protein